MNFTQPFADIYWKIRAAMHGGLSTVYKRKMSTGDVIRYAGTKICRNIVILDYNSLYPSCYRYFLPTGYPIVRRAPLFFPEYPWITGYSAVDWLEWTAFQTGHKIQHMMNYGEKKLPDVFQQKSRFIDGWAEHEGKQYCYFYSGCYHHNHFCQSPFHVTEKYLDLMGFQQFLRDRSYVVINLWECQWAQMKSENPEIEDFLKRRVHYPHHRKSLSEKQIIDAIVDGSLFGFLEADVHTPKHLYEKFCEWPLITKNASISPEDSGPYMSKVAEELGMGKKPRGCLISSYFGEKLMLITPLVKFYLKQGLKITKIYSFTQYRPKVCFEEFLDKTVAARQQCANDPRLAAMADTYKLNLNSTFGRFGMDKSKFQRTTIVPPNMLNKKIRDPFFREIKEISPTRFEINSASKIVKHDIPAHVAVWILQSSKLKMVTFLYDILHEYIPQDSWELLLSDTDSFMIAIAAKTLSELVFPHKKEQWDAIYSKIFTKDEFDKRDSLMKSEGEGEHAICLNSKTYILLDDQFRTKKQAAKGVQQGGVNELLYEYYHDVLYHNRPHLIENSSFRRNNERKMTTMVQIKTGLSPYYAKRRVLEDAVHTTALLI